MHSNRNAAHSTPSAREDPTSTSWLTGEVVDHESDDSSDELGGPPDDLTYHIQKLRIDFVNWQLDWGETNWETEFANQLHVAQQKGEIRNFIDGARHIVRTGRDLLYELKFIGEVSCNNTPDEIRDLFLQGYDMAIAIALQVKFFEVKLYQILQNSEYAEYVD
jgi:hypothetical protein